MNLKPGRELDALIAEKVMNLPDVRYEKWSAGNQLVYGPESKFGISDIVPYYSTAIRAAWKVVDKMRRFETWCEVHPLDLTTFTLSCDKDDFFVGFLHSFSGAEDSCDLMTFMASSESAPHAICLSALKAIGYEV